MKVNDANSGAVAGAGQSLGVQAPTGGSGGRKSSSASSDQVQLSSLGSQLSAMQSDSPQRGARVDQLAAMVANGSYSVDSKSVSSSILRFMGA